MPRPLSALSGSALLALTLLPPTLAGTSCAPDEAELAGDRIGQYAVRGDLESNACGAGYDAPSQLWFHVELRRTESSTIAYWKLPDEGLAQGTVVDDVFRFVDRQEVVAIDGEPDIGVPGCVLERTETIALTLHPAAPTDGGAAEDAGTQDDGGAVAVDSGAVDSGAVDAGAVDAGAVDSGADAGAAGSGVDRLLGTITIAVAVVPGSECSALLELYGGPFPTLPCELRVALVGDRLEEELW